MGYALVKDFSEDVTHVIVLNPPNFRTEKQYSSMVAGASRPRRASHVKLLPWRCSGEGGGGGGREGVWGGFVVLRVGCDLRLDGRLIRI